MITHFEQQQLLKLKEITSKKAVIHQLKDKCNSTQMQLKRDLNRLQAIHSLYHSHQYQELLQSTIQSFHQFQSLKKEYELLPQSSTIKLQKMQLNNQNMEAEVFELQFNIQRQKQREKRIDLSFNACEETIDELINRKSQVEADICLLKEKLAHSQSFNKELINELCTQTDLCEEDLRLLQGQQYQKLQFKYSQQIKNANILQSNLLLELAEKYNLLHQLQHQHDSAQRLFSHYSSCESENDLIAEQQNLIDQFNAISQQIQKEEHNQRQILMDCEENVRNEAVSQAHEWIANRLQDVEKKKNTIAALLQIIVPSQESTKEIEQIEQQMKALQEQQSKLRERLNN